MCVCVCVCLRECEMCVLYRSNTKTHKTERMNGSVFPSAQFHQAY